MSFFSGGSVGTKRQVSVQVYNPAWNGLERLKLLELGQTEPERRQEKLRHLNHNGFGKDLHLTWVVNKDIFSKPVIEYLILKTFFVFLIVTIYNKKILKTGTTLILKWSDIYRARTLAWSMERLVWSEIPTDNNDGEEIAP